MEDTEHRQRKPMNMGLEEGRDFCALLEVSLNTSALEYAGVCLSWSQTWSQTRCRDNSVMENCVK